MTFSYGRGMLGRTVSATPGAGRRPARILAISPVLAAVAGIRPERDGLVLPGGVERREVGGIGIGLEQQGRHVVGLGFRGCKRDQRTERSFVSGSALAQPFGQGRENM
jgi:hypothetical protein